MLWLGVYTPVHRGNIQRPCFPALGQFKTAISVVLVSASSSPEHVVADRCRKISEAGSQQLLLDTQAIKGLLLELPSAGISPALSSPLLRI